MLRPPFRSEYDPSEESEGSIDPLGLQPVYERLADRILPAVTVRMGRPRFVTAMAVGARVCEDFDDEELASDGITPPWLVLEWHVVEAFVRAREHVDDVSAIAGIQKVQRALRNQRAVCATSYLKTPTVFGYSGTLRRLARHLRVLTDDGRLDEAGYRLVSAWETDQGLPGFLDRAAGPGAAFLDDLRRAVVAGLRHGRTTTQPGDFWRAVATRLDPGRPGRKEAATLAGLIRERSGPPDMVAHLTRELLGVGHTLTADEEPAFLRESAAGAPRELRSILAAIDAYETFGRTLTIVFDHLRFSAGAAAGTAIKPTDLAAWLREAGVFASLRESIDRLRDHPELSGWESELATSLARFDGLTDEAQLVDAVVRHHEAVQRAKPPEGKRAWLERPGRERYLVRPAYVSDQPVDVSMVYVHNYRMPTFSRFLGDLGALR